MSALEGWLNKQGRNFKTWRRRYFELKLDGPRLVYRKTIGGKIQGEMELNCAAVHVQKEPFDKFAMSSVASIVTSSRKLFVQAVDDEDLLRWMLAIEGAITLSRRLTQAGGMGDARTGQQSLASPQRPLSTPNHRQSFALDGGSMPIARAAGVSTVAVIGNLASAVAAGVRESGAFRPVNPSPAASSSNLLLHSPTGMSGASAASTVPLPVAHSLSSSTASASTLFQSSLSPTFADAQQHQAQQQYGSHTGNAVMALAARRASVDTRSARVSLVLDGRTLRSASVSYARHTSNANNNNNGANYLGAGTPGSAAAANSSTGLASPQSPGSGLGFGSPVGSGGVPVTGSGLTPMSAGGSGNVTLMTPPSRGAQLNSYHPSTGTKLQPSIPEMKSISEPADHDREHDDDGGDDDARTHRQDKSAHKPNTKSAAPTFKSTASIGAGVVPLETPVTASILDAVESAFAGTDDSPNNDGDGSGSNSPAEQEVSTQDSSP